jgi:diguanylate cyclase (GGDEF)-like protein
MGVKNRVFRMAFIASTIQFIFVTTITFFIFSNKLFLEENIVSRTYLLRNYAIGIILLTICLTIFALLLIGKVFDRSINRLALIRKEDALKFISDIDPLTNISNRRSILTSIENAISNFDEYGTKFCLIMFNLDNFKNINDTYGHLFGDKILKKITSTISNEIRKYDTLGRYGGDEFLLLLPSTKISSGVEVAERIRKKIEGMNWEYEIAITVSCGIVEVKERDSLNCLLKRIDSFIYMAKKNGKNVIASRNKIDNEKNLKIIENSIEYTNQILEYDILQGMEKKEFEVYYQPKVDLLNEKIEFEGLMRWNHKELGVLGADTFIPLAEENSLILALSTYLIEKIKEDTKKLKTKISLNLSLSHFNNSFFLERLLNDTIDLENIEFEITEEFFSGDSEKSIEKINFLNELGFNFLIDDFGTGYSSLYRLANLPITTLKIDRCFVQNMFKSEKDMILLETIINLGHRLKLKVIVEGVENKEEVDFLKKLGVHLFQGYYFGKPEPIEEVLKKLDEGFYIK